MEGREGKEAGFTLMETLVVLALLMVCAGAVSGVVFTAARGVRALRGAAERQAAALRIERRIRETVEAVSVPYWERDERGFEESRRLLAAVAGGDALTALEPLRDRAGLVRGVRYRYRLGNAEYTGSALFGSIPVMGEVR
jgi:type II secretory pathway pseudopilin PulG